MGPIRVSKAGATPGLQAAVDGPLAMIVEVPLWGWVYQREQEQNVILFDDGTGERELLVASPNQTLILEGVWLADGEAETAEVVYQRADLADQQSATTLRAYSMATGDIRELTVTGGFESASSFSTINDRYAVSRFSGEGHYELSIVDLVTGNRAYSTGEAGIDCFDGGETACPDYDQAVAVGSDIFGFGSIWNESEGVVDQFGIYRFDTTSGSEEILASYPWDNGAFFAVDMILVNNSLVVSLSTEPFNNGLGPPLRPLIFNLETGESTLGPEPGFVQLSWLS